MGIHHRPPRCPSRCCQNLVGLPHQPDRRPDFPDRPDRPLLPHSSQHVTERPLDSVTARSCWWRAVTTVPNRESIASASRFMGAICIDNSLFLDMLSTFRDPSERRDEPGLPYLRDSQSRLVPGRSVPPKPKEYL